MKRGDIIRAVFSRELGKPRPALVVQSDTLDGLHSVLLCPFTAAHETSGPLRLMVQSDADNGLSEPSLLMIDKLMAVPKDRCREPIGRLDGEAMAAVNGLLYVAVGLAD